MQEDAGVGCGGPGGVTPWLARGPPKAGLAASYVYILIYYLIEINLGQGNDINSR